MVTGRDLIAMGFKPAKWFGEALKEINEGCDSARAIAERYAQREIKIEPFDNPKNYYKHIKAETPEEEDNIRQVITTMDEVMKTPTVVTGAIMPDACPTGEKGQIPVGGVVVTKNAIHPSMHSSDVCCSVMISDLGFVDPKYVMEAAMSVTHFGAGGRNSRSGFTNILETSDLFDQILNNYFTKDFAEKALFHMGTQGDGNHFLFVGYSKNTGRTCIVTHHGSRGFGASVYKKGMAIAEKYRRELAPTVLQRNAWIPYDEKEGQLYWEALQIVREWTKMNHSSLHNKIANNLNRNIQDTFWNEHNFVFKEDDLFYHAKGATPIKDEFVPDNFVGLRIIPLNMSEPILIVRGNKSNATNLGFAPHGAGRNISRGQHKRNNARKTVEQIFREETRGLDVRFYSGKIDISELPSAYKNAETVKKQIVEFDLAEVVDEIIPYGCIMAGENNFKRK